MHPRVHRTAVTQHGVVGRRQLLGSGIPAPTIDAWLQRGSIGRVSRGVYLLAGAPLTPRAEMVAAALRCGPGARIAGERVLAAVGVHTAEVDGPFVVLTTPGRVVTGVQWRWRTDRAPERDDSTVDGIPSVLPARSLLEVAVDRADDDLERLVDGCRWRGRILQPLRRLLLELPNHPGTARLRDSGLVDGTAGESPKEREVAQILVGLGAEQQVWLSPAIRVDFLFRGARLVLEYRGKAAHDGDRARAEDEARDDAIQALGYAVRHLDAADLRDPRALRRRVRGLLDALSPGSIG